MTERKETLHLYHLLMELPREKREEIVVEEFGLAHGKEPEGDTERANWYRSALTRLVHPRHDVDAGEVMERVRGEVEAGETSPEDVGVMSG